MRYTWVYWTAISLILVPLLPGFAGILLPALSYIPTLGYTEFSVSGFIAVFDWHGVTQSIHVTLLTGTVSTLLAVCLSFLITRNLWNSQRWRRLQHLLTPVIALPHAAFAIGFLFLFSQTGWLARIIDPISLPLLTQDKWGIGLIVVLTVKEVPFLLLMSLSVLQRLDVNKQLTAAQSLGYSPQRAWHALLFPQWLSQMRLPIFAVLAYGLSNVELAYILGPQRPPTFAVLVWQWFNEPNLDLFPRAAAGAAILLAIGLTGLAVWWCAEHAYLRLTHHMRLKGKRHTPILSTFAFHRLLWLPLIVLPTVLIWSFTFRWRFPDVWPNQLSFKYWQQEVAHILELSFNSLAIAIPTALFALILVVAILQFQRKRIPMALIAIPLVVPHLSVLFGIQVFSYWIDSSQHWLWVYWTHFLFVFPYLYLSLRSSWDNIDPRIEMTAMSLGLSPWQAWWKVKFHYLLPAICIAFGVGISVSFALYLPTQMLGGGRISTITTEAVALVSGGDRRITAIYALLQATLPLIVFGISILAQQKSQQRLMPPKRHAKQDTIYALRTKKPHYK
ncbi:ABC transporter permease [Thaumasiovibrio subtropicus]|uniref:ABC transporter permease n=1 Tax=Thaumasiovibrio subtropicus TaxID=1891207 RepID=UPI000B356575|nr:hypothetical protein [Thaumasiovibrio subtropicus]